MPAEPEPEPLENCIVDPLTGRPNWDILVTSQRQRQRQRQRRSSLIQTPVAAAEAAAAEAAAAHAAAAHAAAAHAAHAAAAIPTPAAPDPVDLSVSQSLNPTPEERPSRRRRARRGTPPTQHTRGLHLDVYGITVNITVPVFDGEIEDEPPISQAEEVRGTIDYDGYHLKRRCDCGDENCVGSCRPEHRLRRVDRDKIRKRLTYNGAIDGILSMILAHAMMGINIRTSEYQESVRQAIDKARQILGDNAPAANEDDENVTD